MKTDRDQAVDRGASPLDAAATQAAFSGHTMAGNIPQYSIDFVVYYAPSGIAVGKTTGSLQDRDRGQWRVAKDGQLCVRWGHWDEGEETCRAYWQDGDRYKVFHEHGRMLSSATRQEGNAQKLELRSDLELAQSKTSGETESAAALRELLVGNTASGILKVGNAELHMFYAKDGQASVRVPSLSEEDTGKYRITDEGQLCVTWKRLQRGRETCGSWLKEDKGFRVFDSLGTLSFVAKVRPGDPEKLTSVN